MYPYNKRSQELCLYPLNGQPCLDKNCQASHDRDKIRQKREWANKKPCKHGKKCTYLFYGTCCWLHSEDQFAYVERKWETRAADMTHELVEVESVQVPDEPLTGLEFSGITDVRHLASFNKVADGEIAVPGQY